MTFEMLEEHRNAVLRCTTTVTVRLVLMIITLFTKHLLKNYTSSLNFVKLNYIFWMTSLLTSQRLYFFFKISELLLITSVLPQHEAKHYFIHILMPIHLIGFTAFPNAAVKKGFLMLY